MLTSVPMRMHDDEVEVTEELVGRLLAAQMPHLADQPLSIVEPWGTDNGIWRLGDDLVVRLPRIGWAEGQVDLEATWLPRLGPHLPIRVPVPVAIGEPAEGYPYRWAVHHWIPGEPASLDTIDDPITFALDLADVVRRLQSVPTAGAPSAPPARNRARPLRDYDGPTRRAIHGAASKASQPAPPPPIEEQLPTSSPGTRFPGRPGPGTLPGSSPGPTGSVTPVVSVSSSVTVVSVPPLPSSGSSAMEHHSCEPVVVLAQVPSA